MKFNTHTSDASYMHFATSDGGATRTKMTILNDGNVGIGIIAPAQALDIKGSLRIEDDASTDTAILLSHTDDDGWATLYKDTAASVHFHANAASYINGGNVGIGTTNPTMQLMIEDTTTGSANQGAELRLSSNDGGALNIGARLGTIYFSAAEDSSSNYINGASIQAFNSRGSDWDTTNNHTDLAFFTTTGDNSSTEKMRISDDGLVGIGISPTSPFHVQGVISSGSAPSWNFINTDNTTANACGMSIQAGADSTSTGYQLQTKDMSGNVDFFIRGDGNVGIGTTAPGNKLTVASTATFQTAIVGAGDGIYGTLDLQAQKGSIASPTDIEDDNYRLGRFRFMGYESSSQRAGAEINAWSDQAWTGSAYGTRLVFSTVKASTTNLADNLVLDGNSRISLSNNDGNTENTVFGYQALTNSGTVLGNVGADYNTAIGHLAMGTGNTTTALYNTALGYKALEDVIGGDDNVGIGANAGKDITSGEDNVLIGSSAGLTLTDANQNIAIGQGALKSHTTGGSNVAIGNSAMADTDSGSTAQGSTGNVFIGNGVAAGVWANVASNNNVGIGSGAMNGALEGIDECVIIGKGAGTGALHEDANGLVSIGFESGVQNTDGRYNTFIGRHAGYENDGDGNTAIGYNAFSDSLNTLANLNNTFIGYNSGSGTWLTASSDSNVGVGAGTLAGAMDNADNNTAVGQNALAVITTGTNNVAIGTSAGAGNDTCLYTVLIGSGAGVAIDGSGSNGANGTVAVGYSAGAAITSGVGNVAIGLEALTTEDDGDFNTAVGYAALNLQTGTSGTVGNTAVGYNSGKNATLATYSTFVGYNSGSGGQSSHVDLDGDHNTCIGAHAGNEMQGASHSNTIVGSLAGYGMTTATQNVIIGKDAGYAITDESDCVLIGYDAGTAITTTGANGTVAVGKEAAFQLQSGDGNTAIGMAALYSEDDGDFNTAVGEYALLSQSGTTGEVGNTAVGYNAGEFVTTGKESTFIGSKAGQGITGVKLTGNLNTCIGETSGTLLQGAAAGNTLVGARAGDAMTTGAGNTIMGQSTVGTLTTGNYNTVVGWGANVDAAGDQYHTRIGMNGALRYMTAQITLDDFTTVANDDAATSAIMKIPQYSFLKRVTCTVVQANGGGTGEYNITLGTASDESPGDTVAGRVELIGQDNISDSNFTGATFRQSTKSADGDTQTNIETAKHVHIWEADQSVDDSSGWTLFEGQDMYMYVCHANAGNATNAENCIVRITAEYFGED